MAVLFIDACFRNESRTRELADCLLTKIGGECHHLYLPELGLKPLDAERLSKRDSLLQKGDLANPFFDLANEFASSETIVIAAPYYDMGFPALLKTYLESIYVIGIVSDYDPNGMPIGLCKANKLYYVTTAGGPYDPRFSFDYIKALCQGAFGIPEVELLFADNLDVAGVNVKAILSEAKKRI